LVIRNHSLALSRQFQLVQCVHRTRTQQINTTLLFYFTSFHLCFLLFSHSSLPFRFVFFASPSFLFQTSKPNKGFFYFFFFFFNFPFPLHFRLQFSPLPICFIPWLSPKPFFPLIYSNFLEFATMGCVSEKPSCRTLCVHLLRYPWLFLAESC